MFRQRGNASLTPRTSDADLCRAAALGSGEALSVLYRRHGALIYRFALRVGQDVSLAEEVTQDTFVALLKDPARYDPNRGKLSTWLCGIARRMIWRHLERSGRFAPFDEDNDPQSTVDNPLVTLTRKEAVSAVRDGLDTLPEPLRAVIVLCEFEEMSYEEVAAILAVPIGTIRSRLHRAKARLTKVLGAVSAPSSKENCS